MSGFNPGNGSIGSYGYAIKCLAEGLQVANENGWVTHDEAKDEFRSHVLTIEKAKAIARRAADLRKTADEIESGGNEYHDDTSDRDDY
jgi:hypothetical protein